MIYIDNERRLIIEFGYGRIMVTNIKDDKDKPIGIAIWKPNQALQPVGTVINTKGLTADDVETHLMMYFNNIEGALVLKDYLDKVIENFKNK